MNFLAHFAVAAQAVSVPADAPLFVCGTALPDLLPLVRPRPRLKPERFWPAPQDDAEASLAAGVRVHLATDTAFHKALAFGEAQEKVRLLLEGAGFEGIRVRSFFAAHVLAELALDAALLRADPALADAFYSAWDRLTEAQMHRAADWTAGASGADTSALPAVLRRFRRHPYLRSYATDAGVAEGFSRICGRARQDGFAGANRTRLEGVVGGAVEAVGRLSDALLTQTAERLNLNPSTT